MSVELVDFKEKFLPHPIAVRADGARRVFGLGLTPLRKLWRAGDIRSVKIGEAKRSPRLFLVEDLLRALGEDPGEYSEEVPLWAAGEAVERLFGISRSFVGFLVGDGIVRSRKVGTSRGCARLYRVQDLVEYVYDNAKGGE